MCLNLGSKNPVQLTGEQLLSVLGAKSEHLLASQIR